MIGLLLLVPDLLAIVPITLAILQPDDVGLLSTLFAAVFLLGALAMPSAVAFCLAIGRTRFNNRISRGRRAAHAVWSSGFYCHQRGRVFWPSSPAPNIPARQAFIPEHFRWFVWDAGDYVNA
ncbi:hypothetical protein ACQPW1_30100 [Nocardia sp. CA-128927]|uniref:hypothetical protein n=1 Tax=Nocardia sp. CA-128927 TaxID=3239975 RepID=UPI003D953BCE